jgi:ABC-2 type transport system ATP-binding protein
MAALLSTEHLSRDFGSRRGVDGFALTLDKGDIVGLAGLNGAGKSTTLAMLAGVLRPTRGRVLVSGRDLFRDAGARADVGFAPDNPPLYAELTIREYLRFSAALRGLKGPQINAAVRRMLDDWVLGETADRLIRSLSRGYRQRLGLAQALIHRPPVLLLDEPTQGLDPQQVERFRELMTAEASAGAVLLSTHRLDVIAGFCNRLMVLHDGQVVHQQELAGESAARLHALFASATGTEAA